MLIVINNNNLRPWLYGTLITGGKWENGFGLITIFIGWRYLLKCTEWRKSIANQKECLWVLFGGGGKSCAVGQINLLHNSGRREEPNTDPSPFLQSSRRWVQCAYDKYIIENSTSSLSPCWMRLFAHIISNHVRIIHRTDMVIRTTTQPQSHCQSVENPKNTTHNI